jgi:hypothetical protein
LDLNLPNKQPFLAYWNDEPVLYVVDSEQRAWLRKVKTISSGGKGIQFLVTGVLYITGPGTVRLPIGSLAHLDLIPSCAGGRQFSATTGAPPALRHSTTFSLTVN